MKPTGMPLVQQGKRQPLCLRVRSNNKLNIVFYPIGALKAVFLSCALLLSTELQTGATDRHVLHKHKNGKPKVVVFVIPGTQEIVKEEVYYESGQVNWIGHFKKDLEHGEWIYYWPNGKMKKKETYQNGLEEGTSYEYNEQGILVKEVFYKKGQATGYRNH